VPPHSQISIRWANNGTMPGGQLALLAPGAAEGSPPLAVQTAGPTEHLTLSAVSRLGGRYVLDFAPAGVPVTYSFVAQVTPLDAGPMRTAVAVDLPKAVHKGRLNVTAVVQPATAQPHGRCRLEARRHGVWRSLKGVPVGRLGRCRFDVRLPRGTVLLRVRYVPAATFAPSTSPARRLTVS
jgi:hypothetical protein